MFFRSRSLESHPEVRYHRGLEETSMKMLPIAATAFVLLTACTQAPAPMPDTRAADEQAIRDQETVSQQAWAAKDTDRVASLYADDATVMLPDTPAMTGKAAISAAFKGVGVGSELRPQPPEHFGRSVQRRRSWLRPRYLHGASDRCKNQESHHGKGQLRPGVQETGGRLLEDRGRYRHSRSARHADRRVDLCYPLKRYVTIKN